MQCFRLQSLTKISSKERRRKKHTSTSNFVSYYIGNYTLVFRIELRSKNGRLLRLNFQISINSNSYQRNLCWLELFLVLFFFQIIQLDFIGVFYFDIISTICKNLRNKSHLNQIGRSIYFWKRKIILFFISPHHERFRYNAVFLSLD